MKVLIVHSGNSVNDSSEYHFIREQTNAIKNFEVEIFFFTIKGKGALGYIRNLRPLISVIKTKNIDIIHAHYGLSGILCLLQNKVPVITTFHGSDIHSLGWKMIISRICANFSSYNIFVADYLRGIIKFNKNNYIIQPCGLDLELVKPISKKKARQYFGWSENDNYILFSGSYTNVIKNYSLAKEAIKLSKQKVNLIELKGFDKKDIPILLSACNCLLLTSHKEGSPTIIKEAMACNTPIVSTDVGDVRDIIANTSGCFITSFDPNECSNKIIKALIYSKETGNTNGRNRIIKLGLDNNIVAQKIVSIYKNTLQNE